MDKASVYGTGDCRFESYQGQLLFGATFLLLTLQESSANKNSAAGTRTRVARVRAEYPNQLDYSGLR